MQTRSLDTLGLWLAGLLLTAACGGSPTGPGAATEATPDPEPAAATLREAATRRGMSYGCAVQATLLAQDSAYASLAARECGIIVPENDLKWGTLRPAQGAFNFERADAVVRFAQERGLPARGHTLAWHLDVPAWVTPAAARQELETHIAAVVGRYRGRMHSWDVVNEAIDPASGRADGLRDSPWLRMVGPDYVEIAFRAAAAADPSAILVYNENGLEYTWGAPKRAHVLALLRRLRERGVPVHALGIQGHLTPRTQLDVTGLREFLGQVAALGITVMVTELDVADESLPADPALRDQAVADQYTRFLDVVLAQSATRTVVTWGLTDRYSWLHAYKPRPDGLRVRGLPFDETLGAKPAYAAIAGAMARAPRR